MRHFAALLSAGSFVVLGAAAAVQADMGDQLFKLLAEDGADNDDFGECVAISGQLTIVGADGNEDFGDHSGSAYIFDAATGKQLFKLLADDGAERDFFGGSVAIGGPAGNEIAVVGARLDDNENGENAGAVYLFSATTGEQIAKLLAEDGAAEHQFGVSVGIHGTTVIIGAWYDDDNGEFSGSAYLFNTATGRQIGKLLPEDGAADHWFGVSVAIGGSPGAVIAIVGAGNDDDNGEDAGAAYLFDVATGQQLFKLLPDDGAAGDGFGLVGIGVTTAIVGAAGNDDLGVESGSAYLFDTTTGAQIAKLLPNTGAPDDQFGSGVGISGSTAIVGARNANEGNGNDSGAAYFFDVATGEQIAMMVADDGESGDRFGEAVAIDGAIAIIGESNHRNSMGAAFLFEAACACDEPEVCDCNGNGVLDACDIADGISADCNGNGVPDECESLEDCNDNGVPDACDIADGASADCNGNGIPDECDIADGVSMDCDENGIPDECEIDCNDNGVPDACDIADGVSEDCNRNAIPDECEIDCNANGVPDDCDIANGASFDCDVNGVPDDCKSLLGDLNADGIVGTTDLLVLLSFWGSCDDCDKCYADIDCDCTVGSFDLILLLGNWS